MQHLPLHLRWYLFAVFICASLITSIAIYLTPPSDTDKTTLIVFFVLITLVSVLPVRYTGNMIMFLSTTLDVAASLVLSPVEVILIMSFGNLLFSRARTTWYKAIFNVCQHIITIGTVAILFSYTNHPPIPASPWQFLWVSIACVFYTVTTMLLMGTVITLSDPSGYNYKLLKQNVLGIFTYVDVTLFIYGVVLGILWFVGIQAFTIGLTLLVALYWALRSNADLDKATTQQRQIQEALANLLVTKTMNQQLELLLKQLWHLFPIEHASVVLFDGNGEDGSVIVSSPEARDLQYLCSRTDLLRSLSAKQSIIHIDQDPECAQYCSIPVLLIPLVVSDELVGSMLVGLRNNTLDSQDLQLLTTYATQASLAIVQARLIDRLQTSQEQLIRSERLAAVGTLAAGVGHEFNNVLAIICSTAEVAATRHDCTDHLRALNTISTTAKRGGSITQGLLTFTRQIEPRRDCVRIEDTIDPVIAMLTPRLKAGNIVLHQQIMSVPSLVGDVGLLSQAVFNIVANAIDAMPDGGTLTIRAWDDPKGIHLSVQDTGVGIPEDIRPKLFEPFITSKHAHDQMMGGSGLGLAITYGIVTGHGGMLEVESERGCGTTMTMTLPVGDDTADVPAPIPARVSTAGPLRVMVVDDEPLIAMGLAQILEMDGHQVAWFDDSEQAFAAIQDEAPDLLIADIQMPRVDGLTLLRHAKAVRTDMRQILITGQMHAHQRSEVLALGTEVVYKPFSATDIRTVLGQATPLIPRALPSNGVPERTLSLNHQERTVRDDIRHRLLNHVSALEGLFHMLRRPSADPVAESRRTSYLVQAISELSVFVRAQRLLGLLDQSGRSLVLNAVSFQLDTLLREAGEWIEAGRLINEDVIIAIECPPDLEVVGDTKSLLPALLAALQNSMDSTRRVGQGTHAITIRAECDGMYTSVTIEDTGAGFDPALLDQLTRMLNRGRGEQFIGTLRPRYGVGLGIALMVRVAQLHGGSVAFGNRLDGTGAWTQFTLPVQPVAQTIAVGGVQTSFEVVAG